ncbi:MAG: NAAT family transporter [Acidobacteriia bacterium]|nr:NAAT family transporter [Terriglobia bacterium]
MQAGLAEFVRTVLLIVGALFPIVNPLGNVPIFLSMTPGFTPDMRTVLARKIALNGFLLLAGSILVGTHVLAFFGISLPVVQVGGGMVVIATAWSLLNRRDDPEGKHETRASASAADLSSRAFYPLTMPLTVGPGSISVAIAVGANRPQGVELNWSYLPAAILGAVLVAITIYLSYRFAQSVARALGDTAMKVIIRLSSFILLCIGVQIGWNGVSALLRSVLGHSGRV